MKAPIVDSLVLLTNSCYKSNHPFLIGQPRNDKMYILVCCLELEDDYDLFILILSYQVPVVFGRIS